MTQKSDVNVVIPLNEYERLQKIESDFHSKLFDNDLYIMYSYATGTYYHLKRDEAIESLVRRIKELEDLPFLDRVFKSYPWIFKP